jgi:hypothetical protein
MTALESPTFAQMQSRSLMKTMFVVDPEKLTSITRFETRTFWVLLNPMFRAFFIFSVISELFSVELTTT